MILPQIIWLQNLAFHQFEIFLIYSVLEAFEGKELKILEPINLIYEKLQILYVLLKYNAPTFDLVPETCIMFHNLVPVYRI